MWAVVPMLCIAACSDESDWLRAGPMLGHVGVDEVRVWFQVADGASVRATLHGSSSAAAQAPDETLDLDDGCRIAVFRKVSGPSFEVRITGGDDESRRVTARLAPPPDDRGRVVIAFGSCSRDAEFRRAPIFARIPEHAPDLMIHAGDNSYFVRGGDGPTRFSTTTKDGEWDSREKMLARHLQTRRLPSLQKLLRSCPSYAIWDDHDYGPNDSDASFEHKDEALRAFRQVWANPPRTGLGFEGIATRFRRGPVEIWLLDNRWFKRTRGKDKKPLPKPTIWGEAQLAWLESSLRESTAPVKVIVNGTQIFEEGHVGEGHWQEAKAERARFLEFLRSNRIDGVVVLSGDRHHHELMRVGPSEGAWIYEFTSAPLQYGQSVGPIPAERSNPTRIWGTRGNGFGLVTIDVRDKTDGTLRFELFGEDGTTPKDGANACATEIALRDLYYER